jgi:hypothetical protein
MPYLAQLLAGYRRGLDHDPPESGEAVRAALAGENDAYRRGLLLGLLANSLVQSERSSSKIGETTKPQRAVIEAIQKPRMHSGLLLRFEDIWNSRTWSELSSSS